MAIAVLVVGLGVTLVTFGVEGLRSATSTWVAGSAAPSAPASASAQPSASELRVLGLGATGDQAARETLTVLLKQYDDQGPAEFAVTVENHRTGEIYHYNAETRFETASIVKVQILATLILQAQQAGRSLTTQERSLAKTMIVNSDNDSATALWQKIGKGRGLQAAEGALGMTETVPDPDGYWGLTMTTTGDQARLLDAVANPSGPLGSAGDTDLLQLMRGVAAGQDWGISAAARSGETVALKDGWLAGTGNGGWTINSVGRVADSDTDATLTVLSRGNTTMDEGVKLVETIAQATRQYLAW